MTYLLIHVFPIALTMTTYIPVALYQQLERSDQYNGYSLEQTKMKIAEVVSLTAMVKISICLLRFCNNNYISVCTLIITSPIPYAAHSACTCDHYCNFMLEV